MIGIIAAGGGVVIVIAMTGAGIEKTGMTAAEIATTVGVTGIGTVGAIGADLDAVGVQRERAGIINRLSEDTRINIVSAPDVKALSPSGARCLPNLLRAFCLS